MRLLPSLAVAATLSFCAQVDAATTEFFGAIFTSTQDGSVVNGNVFGKCTDVYLNGGPRHLESEGLPDGIYFFQVTDPSGSVLLSTDAAINRQLLVIGGRVAGATGPNPHLNGTFNPANGTTPVQLWPFSATPNPGRECKAWLIRQTPDTSIDASDPRVIHFLQSDSKTDNFKCVEIVPPPPALELVCPLSFEVCNEPGEAGAVVNFEPLAVTGGQGRILVWSDPPSGSFFPCGTTHVAIFAMDEAGQFDECGFEITVHDCEPPVLACPPDVHACLMTINGTVLAPGTATATDNCTPAAQIVITSQRSDGAALTDPFPLGTTTITWTATDLAGNSANCSQTVVVVGGTIRASKFYDANANGLDDDAQPIAGWKMTLAGTDSAGNSVPAATGFTGADGAFSFGNLPMGSYTVAEGVSTVGRWIATRPASTTLALNQCAQPVNAAFGNVCLGAGGGLTLGFWSNKNGQNTMNNAGGGMTANLSFLSSLNLRNANGSNFDPANYASFRNWLLNGTAVNMAYMLSVQLSAMELNVRCPSNVGGVSGAALIYAPGTTSANSLGFATVSGLMNEANNELALHGSTFDGSPFRAYQQTLKNALDDGNNNRNFVQPRPCPFSF